ncbi:MAG TPA: CHAT domain-containing tetratricopeptide repeat protein [Pyrinomonadaceae bacterium]|nr:CHAT domain-containing tetratricopeptide repeat protein [Pyrinomonadaceae bacterium]
MAALFFSPVSDSGSTTNENAQTESATNSEAQAAMAAAENLRSKWTAASARQAIEQYQKASHAWALAHDFSNASSAALKAGDLYFLLSEFPEALKQYQNAASLAAKAKDHVAQASALSQMGRLYSYTGKNDLAETYVTKALALFDYDQKSTARIAYGEALSNLGEVLYAKGNWLEAKRQFERALELLKDYPKGEARVHLFTGFMTGSAGALEKGRSEITQALDLYRSVNDRSGEALALSILGLTYSSKIDSDKTIKLQREAIEIFDAIGDRHSKAIALNVWATAYENLNEFSLALDKYQEALRLFEEVGALDLAAVTTFQIGRVHRFTQQYDRALVNLERCLSLSRAANKRRTEANALAEIANVYESQQDSAQTSNQYRKLQKFYQSIGDQNGEATALNLYADFLLRTGKNQEALDTCEHTLSLAEKIDDKGILMTALYNLSRAHEQLGHHEVALSFIQQAIKTSEDVRTNVGSPEFRASYLAGAHKYYALCIDILMQLHRARPNEGFAAAALLVSENSRARSLLDLLSESRANLRQGATADLLEREKELTGLLRSLAQYELELSLSKKDSKELDEIAKRRMELRSEYQDVQTQLRQQQSPLFSLERFAPASLTQIQSQLRDTDTLLLEFHLGDERSYLWAVTVNSLDVYELPARKTIEDATKKVYDSIIARQGVDGESNEDYQARIETADKLWPQAAKELSQMLLGPVFPQLGTRKLLLVTQGALQYLPFEILPVPVTQTSGQTDWSPLVMTNEIARSPSVSTLIAIRSQMDQTASPDNVVAVIADPVFSQKDDRVASAGLSSPAIASAASNANANESAEEVLEDLQRGGALDRLTHSGDEAEAILAAAPRGTVMVAEGFEATSEKVMSSDIRKYQILHFATHGFFDREHPELSGIVLTMVDRNGAPRNGLMPLNDIYNLDLAAELTVLSACQTALGKDVKGEGLVGLTHSFISAGSKSVVASLWKVDDRATAALMTEFYNAMLHEGMPTAAALRSAKLKMMQDKRWSAPYYWAGFVLQGEYTNRIAVERNSSLGLPLLVLSLIGISGGLIFLHRRRRRSSSSPPPV